jgi:hypothetical protein
VKASPRRRALPGRYKGRRTSHRRIAERSRQAPLHGHRELDRALALALAIDDERDQRDG